MTQSRSYPGSPVRIDDIPAGLLFDAHPHPMWIHDLETLQFVEVNPAALTLYGSDRSAFLQRTPMDLVPEQERARLEADLAQGRHDRSRQGVWRHRKHDGSIFPAQVTSHPCRVDGRRVELVMIQDLSAQARILEEKTQLLEGEQEARQALEEMHRRLELHELELAEKEERFRYVARVTTDAIWDWDLRTDSTWWSEGMTSLFGFSRDELESDSRAWTHRIHPEDREAVLERVQAVIDDGGEVFEGEYRFRKADGSYALVQDAGYVIRDSTGRAVRMVGGMSDVTQARQAEAQIREQASLLDRARDAIVLRDLEERIIYMNQGAERIYGWSADEVVGKSVVELDIYPDEETFHQARERLLEDGEWSGELTHLRKDGEAITVEARWTLIHGPQGRPDRILAINTDITQRKHLEAQFFRAQRLESIGTLAGGIAHDLNNVLSPILMSIGLLRSELEDPEIQEILETIEGSAKRGSEMVRQVLTFARGVEGARIPVRVDRLIQDLGSIARETFPRSIHIDRGIPPDLWPVEGDATQLHQVLMNLAVNARDAMPEGGRLVISANNVTIDEHYAEMSKRASPGPYVCIEVADTGTGMSAEVLDRIFDPFFSTKDIGEGTGLGLSTVQAILRSHGGFVNVYSEPDRGTTFKLYLPADPEGQRSEEPAELSPELRGDGEGILVVDDDDDVLEITRQTLEAFGYRVFTAEDGADAVAVYARHHDRIELTLTDMMMPLMDGPAAIQALRRMDPRLKIVAASGLGDHRAVVRASEVGVTHFLPKPFTAGTLLAKLHQVLREAPASAEDAVE